jgi:hypothetical protein
MLDVSRGQVLGNGLEYVLTRCSLGVFGDLHGIHVRGFESCGRRKEERGRREEGGGRREEGGGRREVVGDLRIMLSEELRAV